MALRYVGALLLGLAAGAVLGYLIGAVVALGAMVLIPQDSPPDYAYIPFVIGLVAGPVWGVWRLRTTRKKRTRNTA